MDLPHEMQTLAVIKLHIIDLTDRGENKPRILWYTCTLQLTQRSIEKLVGQDLGYRNNLIDPSNNKRQKLPASKSVPMELGPSFLKLSLNFEISLEKSST